MSNPPELVPDFDRLPEPGEISQIATWLAEARLDSLELSNDAGLRLRIRVPAAAAPVEKGMASEPAMPQAEAGEGTVTVRAPYFGKLCLTHPMRDSVFAPVGATVGQDDVVALLTLGSLQVPVRAPVGGVVEQVVAQPDELLGYGAAILQIRPDQD
ncbi:hypothetical protein DY926_10495 [Komagataeibacter melaceti]|uniref:Lipoyl-binding domain-containing protein n=1 Tax=Komagataeibacter melaceti TaxID=2766577 RepID=A0A371YZC0_9PROT|nr:biotin/lipoyl-containing protein [Komagataeibacter melaceti]RFD19590.1 hypothetical protein DY926_10495 [Komagataeibacter melaceti]